MKKPTEILKNTLITLTILFLCFLMCLVLKYIFNNSALVSAIILLVVTMMTCGLTAKVKHHEAIQAERDKERMRANLLRAISHDLRTPLTTIYGASSALVEKYDDFSDEQCKEMLKGISEDSQWLHRMVENLLSITKLDGENVKIIKAETVLDELVDSVLVKFAKRYPSQVIDSASIGIEMKSSGICSDKCQNRRNSDSSEVSKLLKVIGDFERISDHSINILESAEELKEKDMQFTPDAIGELGVLCSAVSEILTLSYMAFINNDLDSARDVEPLEQVIDGLKAKLRDGHIRRLKTGTCSIEAGFVWADLITNLERTADHCSNIAACVLDASENNMNVHQSVRDMKVNNEYFNSKFSYYAEKYVITD